MAATISLSACSTISNGKNQAVLFSTGDVEGAECLITGGRDGAVRQTVVTPETVRVRRAKAAIDVECSKDDYLTASRRVESKMEGATAGNVLAGGFIGLGVDAMTGSIFKYPDTILIEMTPIIGMDTPTVTGEPVATEEIIS